MIWIASVVLPSLISADGQSKPTGTSFMASPVPTPRPILPGYRTSREAKACAIMAGLYRYTAAVTPVTNSILLVRSAAAANHIQVKLPYPLSCHQG